MATENSESTRAEPRRSVPDWLAIPDRKLQAALDNATWAGLRPAAFGLAALLAALGLSAPLTFESNDTAAWMALTLAAAVALLVAAFVLGRIPPRGHAAPAIAAGMMIFVAAIILLQMRLSQSIVLTTIIMLIVVGSAALILAPQWLLLAFAAAWAGWVAVIAGFLPAGPALANLVLSLAFATLAGCLIYLARVADIRRTERAREELAARSAWLSAWIENVQAGVLVEDQQRCTLQVNAQLCRIFNLPQPPEQWLRGDVQEQAWQMLKEQFADPEREQARVADLLQRCEPSTGAELLLTDGRILACDYSPIIMGDERCGHLWAYRDITEQKRAENALNKRAFQHQALYEASREINTQPDVPALLDAIIRRAAGLLNLHVGGLYLVRPDNETLELAAGHNLPDNYAGRELHFGEGVAGKVAQTGEPLMVDDYQAWESQAPDHAAAGFRRVLGVPLKAENRVIGVIDVIDDEKAGSFAEEEIRLVSIFADQAALVLRNARLMERMQEELADQGRVEEQLRYRVAFDDLVTNLSARFITLPPDEVDDAINQGLGTIGSFVGVDRAYVVLLTAGGATIDNTHEWCAEGVESQIANTQDIPSDSLPWSIARLRGSETIHIPLVAELPAEASAEREFLERRGVQSAVVAPMKLGEELVGFVGFDAVREAKTWGEDDIVLLNILGEIIGNSLERADYIWTTW